MENCTLAPIWVRKMPKAEAEEAAMTYLERVKIPEQAQKFPGQLSGGHPAAGLEQHQDREQAIGAHKSSVWCVACCVLRISYCVFRSTDRSGDAKVW